MRLGACADATTTAACPICRSPCVDVHVSSDAYLTHFCTHPAPSHPTLPPCPPGSASTRAARPPASASSLPPLWATARGGVSAGGRAPATLGAVESSARVFPVAAAGLQELSRLVCRSSAGWSASQGRALTWRRMYGAKARPHPKPTLLPPGSSFVPLRAGADQLSAEGLVDRLIYGWTGTAPGFLKCDGSRGLRGACWHRGSRARSLPPAACLPTLLLAPLLPTPSLLPGWCGRTRCRLGTFRSASVRHIPTYRFI